MKCGAAAALVLLVFWASSADVNQSRTPPTMATSDGPGAAEEFTWETPFKPARYRITVRGANKELVLWGETTTPQFRTDASMRSRLTRGEAYVWKVESLDASGVVIGESLPVTFRYRP